MRVPNPASEREWVDLAMGQNLALVSSRFDEKLARDEISFRRNGHYPSLDLVASVGNQDIESEQDTGLGFLDSRQRFRQRQHRYSIYRADFLRRLDVITSP